MALWSGALTNVNAVAGDKAQFGVQPFDAYTFHAMLTFGNAVLLEINADQLG